MQLSEQFDILDKLFNIFQRTEKRLVKMYHARSNKSKVINHSIIISFGWKVTISDHKLLLIITLKIQEKNIYVLMPWKL